MQWRLVIAGGLELQDAVVVAAGMPNGGTGGGSWTRRLASWN
jgi:hypothetical protein